MSMWAVRRCHHAVDNREAAPHEKRVVETLFADFFDGDDAQREGLSAVVVGPEDLVGLVGRREDLRGATE